MDKHIHKNQRGSSLIGLWPCYGIYIGLVFLLTPMFSLTLSFIVVSVVFFWLASRVAKAHPEYSIFDNYSQPYSTLNKIQLPEKTYTTKAVQRAKLKKLALKTV